jgi:hypothetical protein
MQSHYISYLLKVIRYLFVLIALHNISDVLGDAGNEFRAGFVATTIIGSHILITCTQ